MTPTIVTLWPVVVRTTFLAAFAAAVPATAAPVNGAQTGSHGSAARASAPADDMIKR